MSQTNASARPTEGPTVEKCTTEVEQALVCSICAELAWDPRTTPCDHIFCDSCITKWVDHSEHTHRCPYCNAALTQAQLRDSHLIRGMFNRLTFRCDNHSNGCTETPAYDQFVTHTPLCVYKEVKCTNEGCPEKVLKKDLHTHMGVCVFRRVKCTHEGCTEEVRYAELTAHMSVCVYRKVKCTKQGCTAEVAEKDLKEHQKSPTCTRVCDCCDTVVMRGRSTKKAVYVVCCTDVCEGLVEGEMIDLIRENYELKMKLQEQDAQMTSTKQQKEKDDLIKANQQLELTLRIQAQDAQIVDTKKQTEQLLHGIDVANGIRRGEDALVIQSLHQEIARLQARLADATRTQTHTHTHAHPQPVAETPLRPSLMCLSSVVTARASSLTRTQPANLPPGVRQVPRMQA